VNMQQYFDKLAQQYGYRPDGPAPGEDET